MASCVADKLTREPGLGVLVPQSLLTLLHGVDRATQASRKACPLPARAPRPDRKDTATAEHIPASREQSTEMTIVKIRKLKMEDQLNPMAIRHMHIICRYVQMLLMTCH